MIEVMEAIKKGIKLNRGNTDLDWVLRKLRALNRMASIEKIYGIKNNERS